MPDDPTPTDPTTGAEPVFPEVPPEILEPEPAPPTPDELAARAEAFDKTLFGGEGKGEGEGEGGDATPASTLKAFIDEHYQGNEEAFLQALQATQAERAQLTARLQSLEARLASPGKPGPEGTPPATETASPEIKLLDTEITSVERETTALRGRNEALFSQLGAAEREVAVLEGQIKAAAPEDRLELRTVYDEAVRKRDQLTSELTRNEERITRNSGHMSSLKREKLRAERELRIDEESKREQEQQERQEELETRAAYDAVFAEEAKGYGIKPDSKAYPRLHRSIQSEIYAYVNNLPPDGPGIDIRSAVKQLFAQAAEAYNMGQRATLTRSSAAKREQRASVAPPGSRLPAASPASPGRPKYTLDQVRARRDYILSGGKAS